MDSQLQQEREVNGGTPFAEARGSAPFEHEMKAYQDGRKARAAGILPPPVNYGTSYETAWMLGWKAHNNQAQTPPI